MLLFKWFLLVIKNAVHLDVADFCYLYKPHNIEFGSMLQDGAPKRGLVIRIGSFSWHMVSSLWKWPLKLAPCPQNTVFFFAITQNQDRSLRPLVQKTPNAYFAGFHAFGDHQIPLFWAYLIAIPFFPLVMINFIRSDGLQREAFHYVFDAYWLSYGFYILMRLILRKYVPTTVIMANDHVMWTRVLIKAAADEKIPTIYVQHASVTENFPPLTVNYALLEGLDSAQKYAACGLSESNVFLVGMPRFDKYYSLVNRNCTVQTVGICVNALDTPETLTKVYHEISKNLSELHYVLRPHPGDTRFLRWQELAIEFKWGFSNGIQEDTFQFLSHVDVILAGDSNILLEAALMNVFPIYYDFSGSRMDWYGFHKNGLVPYFSQPDRVVPYLKNMLVNGRPPVRSKAKYYCATIDTDYDGRSTELAVQLIEGIVWRQMDTSDWEEVTSIHDLTICQIRELS